MSNGLFELTVAMLVRSADFVSEVRPLIGVIAALLAGVLAAYAGWIVTDRIAGRVAAWRGRADQDDISG